MVEELTGFILAGVSPIFFGLSKILTRKGILTTNLTSGVFVTILPSVPILLGFALVTGEFSRPLAFTPWTLLMGFLGGFFNHNLGRQLIYGSIKTIGAARTSQVATIQVPLSSLLAVLLLSEDLSVIVAAGTGIVFLGVLLIAFSAPSGTTRRNVGDLAFLKGLGLGLGGSVAWSLAWITSRAAVVGIGSALLAALIGYLFSVVLQSILVVVKGKFAEISKISRRDLSYLLASGFTTSLGYMLYYSSLGFLPVVLVAPLSNLSPVVATIGSYALIQKIERVNGLVIIATILVVLGSYIVVAF
ncbi:MAG: EamA family transporter [Thaumarchaeota archaeon]|nr:EamA family transporter [Nitrososphaerota archaeon]